MKWNIAILFIIIFNFSSYAQKTVKYEDLDEINGIFYEKGLKTPFNGKCITTYPSGKLGMGGYIKDGLRDGEWIWFYENGNKKRFCIYKNGIKQGVSIFYYKNGQKKSEIIFDNDKNIRQTSWDEKGNKIDNPSFSSFQ